jgi:predicted ATPase
VNRARATTGTGGGLVQRIRLAPDSDTGRYPFTLPIMRHLAHTGGLDLDPGVTFLVGDNGTGKSTLVEGLAVAAGFNAEGGSRSFRLATRATESRLGDQLVLRWGTRKPRQQHASTLGSGWLPPDRSANNGGAGLRGQRGA